MNIGLLTTALLAFSGGGPGLSPKNWDLEALRKADQAGWGGIPLATGSKGMVVTTSFGGTSAQAGTSALKQGGQAIDAALATAFTQISLNLGSWSSYAGIMTVVYYDASTGKIHTLHGGWQVPEAEKDPMSIPISSERNERGFPKPGKRTGRGILVPGFMACAQAAHDRFGKLKWSELWEPAIYFAEEGVPYSQMHQFLINQKKEVLQRFPRTWSIFTKDGNPYKVGDVFKQTALAKTLKAVAQEGAGYMYSGPWAQDLVKAVRDEGGNLTMADMMSYRAYWAQPVRGVYGPYEVVGCGRPNEGGMNTAEAFHMLNLARTVKSRPYWENGRDLYNMIQISKIAAVLNLGPQRYGFKPEDLFGNLDYSRRGSRDVSEAMWREIEKPDWPQKLRSVMNGSPKQGTHSDSVLAVDAQGNVAAVTHSINVANWGNSGIFIGGVGISDAGRYQRQFLRNSLEGNHLKEGTNPMIILKDGKPVMASGAVGRALHEVSFQNLVNMMDLDMNPQQAVEAPKFLTPQYDPQSKTPDSYHIHRLVDRGFSDEVVKALHKLGQETYMQDPEDFKAMGYWLGLRINPKTGVIEAGGTMGGARGY